jgi:EAL domain-containing protein (putative c-di-GMP-specific phosphodiesterase class I)
MPEQPIPRSAVDPLSADTAAVLLRERCERAQGYFFARPMPAEEFARELGTRRLRAAR